MSKKIALVLGTARKGNNSQRAFKFLESELNKKDDIELSVVDVSNHLFSKTIDGEDEKVSNWKKIVEENEIFLFVTPEYNHSFPGELKIMLDSLYNEYKGKFAVVAGVSMGPFAGARVIEQLKIVLHTLNFNLILNAINFGTIGKILDEDGTIIDEEKGQKIQKQLDGALEEIEQKLN